MSDELPGMKETVQLRIELRFRNIAYRFLKGKLLNEPVQGKPLKASIVVTNISNVIFKGAKVDSAHFSFNSHNVSTTIDNQIQIPSLNPKDEIELKLDDVTFNLDGSSWFLCKLIPEDENQEILTFQYDQHHQKDSVYKINEWGDAVHVEGKLAALQATTNKYILILTAITVVEAVFGLKNSTQFIASIISTGFSWLSLLFGYISGAS